MPVVEAVPGLAILMSLCLLLAIAYSYDNTLGPLLQAVARWFQDASIHIPHLGSVGFGFIGAAASSLDGTIRHWLADAIKGVEYAWHKFVHWNALAWQELSGAVADLAEHTEQTFAQLIQHKIAAVVASLLAATNHRLGSLEGAVGALEGDVERRLEEALRIAERAEAAAKATAVTIEHEISIGIPHAIERAGAGERTIVHGIDETLKETINRVNRFARTLTPAGIIGLVATSIFAGFDLGWLRCRGVGRVGKSLCGLSGVIEQLFLDAVDALVLTDLCWMIEAMTVAAQPVAAIVTEYGDGLNALLKCRGIKPPLYVAPAYTGVPSSWANLEYGASAP